MRIAIYGDSFTCIHTRWAGGNSPLPNAHILKFAEMQLPWSERLAAEHEVTMFGVSGSAFMYSYEKFLENNANHDLNIFVVTDPHRVYVKALDGRLMFGSYWAREEQKKVKALPWYPRKDDHLTILASVEVYLDKWIDWEMLTHVQHVLVTNLWNVNPKTIVIPAFPNSIKETTKNLFGLAKYELKLVDETAYNKFDFMWLDCHRQCHFSEENNQVIYNKLVRAIKNNEKILTLDESELIKPRYPFEFYVTNNKPDWAK